MCKKVLLQGLGCVQPEQRRLQEGVCARWTRGPGWQQRGGGGSWQAVRLQHYLWAEMMTRGHLETRVLAHAGDGAWTGHVRPLAQAARRS